MVLTCWKRKAGTVVHPSSVRREQQLGWLQTGRIHDKRQAGEHFPGFPLTTEVITPDNHSQHPQGSVPPLQERGESKVSLNIFLLAVLPSIASAGGCREQNTNICPSSDTSNISAPHDW